jgi:uncharacterized membrane protein
MMYGNNMGSGGWMLSIFVTLIVLALLATAAIWVASNRRRGTEGSPSAGEMLDQRLAAGEITTEQYDGLRDTLTATSHAPRPASPSASG